VCGGDGDATIEMSEGIEFLLMHNFMPTSAQKAKNLAYKYPSVAFRVIADDTSLASLKVRALLAADPEKESAFKLKMREWYDDHPIDVASQATFDYIGWEEAESESESESDAALPHMGWGGKGLSRGWGGGKGLSRAH